MSELDISEFLIKMAYDIEHPGIQEAMDYGGSRDMAIKEERHLEKMRLLSEDVSHAKSSLRNAADFLKEAEGEESSDELADAIDDVVSHWMKADPLGVAKNIDLTKLYDVDDIVDMAFDKVSDPSLLLEVLDALIDSSDIKVSDLKPHHDVGNVAQVFADLDVDKREPALAKYTWLKEFVS